MLLKFCRLIWRNHVMHEAGYAAWLGIPGVVVVMVGNDGRVWANGSEVTLLDAMIVTTIVTCVGIVVLHEAGLL